MMLCEIIKFQKCAIIVHKAYNNYYLDSKQWPLTILPMNSWMLVQKKKRRLINYNDYLHSFKGRLTKFKVSGSTDKEVKIQHAYMHSKIKFESWPNKLSCHKPNCKNVFPLFLQYVWQ